MEMIQPTPPNEVTKVEDFKEIEDFKENSDALRNDHGDEDVSP